VNTQLDALAYGNRLRTLPPKQKLFFALVLLVIAMFVHPLIQLAIGLWMLVWTVIYAGIPWRFYFSMVLGVMSFLLTSLLVIIFNFAAVASADSLTDSLWNWPLWGGQLYLSMSGTQQAIEIFSRSLASTAVLFFIILTVPFAELAVVLEQTRLPTILTELLLLCYRFIFLLAEVAQSIAIAQQSRGGYRTRRLAFSSVSLLIRQLIQRTALRYQQIALGIKARGFNQEFRFWQSQPYEYSWRYGLESIAGCVLLVIGEIFYRIYV
jgi:cobalt/nickel transport system permease protein